MSNLEQEPLDRLFVPLTTAAFEDFRDFGKEYEIRTFGKGYTDEFVYTERLVELRKGYGKPNRQVDEVTWRLWGNIGKIHVGSLEDVFTEVGDYRLIEPRASSAIEAIAENKELLRSPERYIGFQVILLSSN